ncbi:MAG: hypothetical protein HDQ89_02730 [Desulfovibrio sp.]|nr:hypothetical protein [Desulfovibrio sp.]
MAGFFTTIGVAVAIILVLCVLFASVTRGFKAMFLGIVARLREALSGTQESAPGKPGGGIFTTGGSQGEPLMKEIVITAGQCQCCGRTYIGTSADSECPLKAVQFMGASKVLCQDCLTRLMADFQRSEKSREKKYSSSAQDLRDLLSNIGSNN